MDKHKVGFLPPSFCQGTFLGGSSLGPDQSNLFIDNEEHESAFSEAEELIGTRLVVVKKQRLLKLFELRVTKILLQSL